MLRIIADLIRIYWYHPRVFVSYPYFKKKK